MNCQLIDFNYIPKKIREELVSENMVVVGLARTADKEKNILLSEVTLNVLWEDKGKTHDIELNTIKVDGELHPSADSLLAKSFGGGPGSIQASENESESESEDSSADESTPIQNISGSSNSYNNYISGAITNHVSGN